MLYARTGKSKSKQGGAYRQLLGLLWDWVDDHKLFEELRRHWRIAVCGGGGGKGAAAAARLQKYAGPFWAYMAAILRSGSRTGMLKALELLIAHLPLRPGTAAGSGAAAAGPVADAAGRADKLYKRMCAAKLACTRVRLDKYTAGLTPAMLRAGRLVADTSLARSSTL